MADIDSLIDDFAYYLAKALTESNLFEGIAAHSQLHQKILKKIKENLNQVHSSYSSPVLQDYINALVNVRDEFLKSHIKDKNDWLTGSVSGEYAELLKRAGDLVDQYLYDIQSNLKEQERLVKVQETDPVYQYAKTACQIMRNTVFADTKLPEQAYINLAENIVNFCNDVSQKKTDAAGLDETLREETILYLGNMMIKHGKADDLADARIQLQALEILGSYSNAEMQTELERKLGILVRKFFPETGTGMESYDLGVSMDNPYQKDLAQKIFKALSPVITPKHMTENTLRKAAYVIAGEMPVFDTSIKFLRNEEGRIDCCEAIRKIIRENIIDDEIIKAALAEPEIQEAIVQAVLETHRDYDPRQRDRRGGGMDL